MCRCLVGTGLVSSGYVKLRRLASGYLALNVISDIETEIFAYSLLEVVNSSTKRTDYDWYTMIIDVHVIIGSAHGAYYLKCIVNIVQLYRKLCCRCDDELTFTEAE